MYAPYDNEGHSSLWDRLGTLVQNDKSRAWCVNEDFNAIRLETERRGRVTGGPSEDFSGFNRFIDDTELVDLPLCGRSFTWFRGDSL